MGKSDPPHVRFSIAGYDPETFFVVEFSGREAISSPYVFETLLVSDRNDISPSEAISKRALLTIDDGQGHENVYGGLLFGFTYLHSLHNQTLYRARLGPRLQCLAYSMHNQVFLNKSLDRIISAVFDECGLTNYQFKLRHEYTAREFTCQYNESHLHFISHKMESLGMYYYFEQTPEGEQPIVTDTSLAHMEIHGGPLTYAMPSGLGEPAAKNEIYSLSCEQKLVPQKVILNDYNYMRPNLPLVSEAETSEFGVGSYYSYYDNFQNQDQGAYLAKVRAQEFQAAEVVSQGESACPYLRSGSFFTLKQHPNDAFNMAYLLTSVTHEGRQTSVLTAGLERFLTTGEQVPSYRNTFTAIPASRQFRPPRVTEKTRFHGVIHAHVDANGSGEYAEVDDMGRYKIRLPFDLSGRPGGRASSWLRRAQPYAGQNYSQHFPLLKNAEVLVAFIDGDPDRPIITLAVHNGEQRTVIKNTNAHVNAIQTAGGNQLVMSDKKGEEYMAMWSPFHDSGIAVGSTKPGGGGSLEFSTAGGWAEFVGGDKNKCLIGTNNSLVLGLNNAVNVGLKTVLNAGFCLSGALEAGLNYTHGPYVDVGKRHITLKNVITQTGLDSFVICGGINKNKEELIKKLLRAMSLMYAADVVASTGIALMTAGSSNCASNAKLGWADMKVAGFQDVRDANHRIGFLAGGGATALVGSGLAVYCGKKVYDTIKDISDQLKEDRISTLKLSNKGIEAKVDTTLISSTNAELMILCGDPKSDTLPTHGDVSSFRMWDEGKKVILANNKTANFEMEDGKKIDISVKNDKKRGCIRINSNTVEIDVDNEPIATFKLDRIYIKSKGNHSGKLYLDDCQARISSGQECIILDNTGINFQSKKIIKAGPLIIDMFGTINIG